MDDRDAALRRLRDALVLTRAAIDDLVDDLDIDLRWAYIAEDSLCGAIDLLEGEAS